MLPGFCPDVIWTAHPFVTKPCIVVSECPIFYFFYKKCFSYFQGQRSRRGLINYIKKYDYFCYDLWTNDCFAYKTGLVWRRTSVKRQNHSLSVHNYNYVHIITHYLLKITSFVVDSQLTLTCVKSTRQRFKTSLNVCEPCIFCTRCLFATKPSVFVNYYWVIFTSNSLPTHLLWCCQSSITIVRALYPLFLQLVWWCKYILYE